MRLLFKSVLPVLLVCAFWLLPNLALAQALPGSPSQPPSPTASLEQLPSSAPEVTYAGGQLKISAHNSTLRDVLALVRARTGTVIEGPVNQASDRVVVELGPASVEDVLRQLLEGSKFDYIILGNAGKPGVQRVILSLRGPAPVEPVAQAAPPQEPPDQEPAVDDPGPPAGMETQSLPAQSSPGLPPNSPGAAVQPETNTADEPMQQPEAPADQNVQSSNPQANPNQPQQPKSPEELLRELQRMQQREQNQNNQKNQ
jgi:hypothetical protein